jgi:hypothetical protein
MPSGHWQLRARCLVRLDVLARLRRRLSRIARPQSSSSCRFAPETHVIERLSCASAIGSMARSSGWRNSAVCPTPRAWKRLEHFLIANVLRLTPTTAHACAATWRALSAAYDSSGWRGSSLQCGPPASVLRTRVDGALRAPMHSLFAVARPAVISSATTGEVKPCVAGIPSARR